MARSSATRPAKLDPRLPLDVVENDLGGDPIQLDRTAGRQPRKSFLDLANDVRAVTAKQGPKAQIETEAAVRASDEVQHGQAGLALRAPEAATKLLEKHERALGRTQEEDGVDLGYVNPFVEEVDAKDYVQLAIP